MTICQANPASQACAVAFGGDRRDLLRLLLRNAALTLVTLGIYRFWAKTSVRRYFWSHVRISNAPLSYTGRPLELIIGFLLALAVLLGLALAVLALRTMINAIAPGAEVMVDVLLYAALLVLIQIAVFRLWRYRLSRTEWRGIRFGLDGSTWGYAWRSMAWLGLTIVTLGCAFPWMRMALLRYRLGRVRYGDGRFVFDGNGAQMATSWAFAFAPILAAILLFTLANLDTIKDALDVAAAAGASLEWAALVRELEYTPGLGVAAVLAALLHVWYRVREFRYLIGRLRFGGASFKSAARASRVLAVFLLTAAAVFVLAACLALGLRTIGPSDLPFGEAIQAAWIFFRPIVTAIAIVLLVPVATNALFWFGLVRHVCGTLAVIDDGTFGAVGPATDRPPVQGEGLADLLDVGSL